jgi:hypothetical protein
MLDSPFGVSNNTYEDNIYREFYMKMNIYYFIVGLLSLLFCVSHALNGCANFIPLIDAANVDLPIKITSLYIWHIISIENLIFGIVFLFMAFNKDSKYSTSTAWVIAVIIVARLLVIFVSTLIRDFSSIRNMAIDSIAIIIYVGLILLGIRKGHQSEKNT